MLDIIIVNLYKLYRGTFGIYQSQREFRVKFASQLFENSKRFIDIFSFIKESLFSRVHLVPERDYGRLERMGDKVKYCVSCLHAKRKVSNLARIRKPFSELSNNSVRFHDLDKRKRRERAPRGIHGCKLCGIYICNHIVCWKEHIKAILCI